MSQEKIRVGFIGCGYWGPNHIRNFSAIRHLGVEVASAADFDQDACWKIATKFPWVHTTTSADEVLEDPAIDAIVVATPPETHFDIAYKAMLQGKHVLVEKPMTLSIEEADTLCTAATDLEKVLMVGHTFEYTAPVAYLEENLSDIGEVLQVRSQRTNLGLFSKHTNVIWDLAPHDLSILLRLFGRPITISCTGRANVGPQVDEAVLNVEWLDKRATIIVSWLDPIKKREMLFTGTEGSIIWDDCLPEDKRVTQYDRYAYHDGVCIEYERGKAYPCEVEAMPEALQLEAADFINAIRTGGNPRATGLSGYDVVRLLVLAEKSLHDGRRMLVHGGL
ncbi:MAG: Gfo/Idh/MocA family protein [Planctomycetota bacterium]|jgi:predicted dehydrogenase